MTPEQAEQRAYAKIARQFGRTLEKLNRVGGVPPVEVLLKMLPPAMLDGLRQALSPPRPEVNPDDRPDDDADE